MKINSETIGLVKTAITVALVGDDEDSKYYSIQVNTSDARKHSVKFAYPECAYLCNPHQEQVQTTHHMVPTVTKCKQI